MQLTDSSALQSYSFFSNWVDQHLAENQNTIAADRLDQSATAALAGLHDFQSLATTEDDKKSGQSESDRNIILSYLFLAWSQHHDASDMATTLNLERIHLQLIQKYSGAWLHFLSHHPVRSIDSDDQKTAFTHAKQPAFLAVSALKISSFLSGHAINAP